MNELNEEQVTKPEQNQDDQNEGKQQELEELQPKSTLLFNIKQTYNQIKPDLPQLLLLFLLYLFQGIFLYYFDPSLQIDFLRQGAQFTQLGIFQFIFIPFSVKIFYSPILDSFYFKKFGKRKSYIIPAFFTISIIAFFLGFFIDSIIVNQQVLLITIIGFIIIFLVTLQDISTDAWSVTLLQEENVAYASFIQSIGQTFGSIISFVIYLNLSDLRFCKYFLNIQKPILTPQSFLQITAISMFIFTLYIAIFQKENQEEEQENDLQGLEKIKSTFKKLKIYMQKKLFYQYCIYLLTYFPCFAFVEFVGLAKLIKENQISNTEYTLLNLTLTPFQILVGMVVSSYCSKNKHFTMTIIAYAVRYCTCVMFYMNSDNLDHQLFLYLYYVYYSINYIATDVLFISGYAFFLRICDPKIGGTIITLLASVSNFGETWPVSVGYFLADWIGVFGSGIVGLIYGLVFLILTFKFQVRLENTKNEEWRI